jgi:hypothetical protein
VLDLQLLSMISPTTAFRGISATYLGGVLVRQLGVRKKVDRLLEGEAFNSFLNRDRIRPSPGRIMGRK